MSDHSQLNDDERRLAELGYTQELNRTWSGFSNFAISFSIISILAGCFTTFYQAWNNGGSLAVAFGWPIISAFILVIGFCMSELVSAYPTSGGIYWWASTLGGPKAGYYTGWLNLVGLLAIVASVAYGCAAFFDLAFARLQVAWFDSDSWAAGYSLQRVFIMFLIVLLLVTLINVFSSHLLAIINNISVWWHVAGALVVVGVLWIVPDGHWNTSDAFTYQVNNTGGLFGGDTGGAGFWLFILPLGFLLTQYTITGYDASAHLSEETNAAASSAAKGIWRSIFYSAIGGYILLMSFLFAIQDPEALTAEGGGVQVIFDQSLGAGWGGLILLIAASGQFYCTNACLTSTSRMMFAFSRDGAVPGSHLWSKLNHNRVPVNAVLVSAVIAILLTLPALIEINIGTAAEPIIVNYAFVAVVSIGVIGLYLAFAIPIWLRWRAGEAFKQGSWNLGSKWKWMAPLAVVEIVVTSIYFIMPFNAPGTPGFMRGLLGAPSTAELPFTWKFVNYTGIVTGVLFLLLFIWWEASVKNWFHGPKRQVELPVGATEHD
ncbi:MAG: amino acid permease [Candidatus Nanopelagicales bacterium]